jgi:hypothetical protein
VLDFINPTANILWLNLSYLLLIFVSAIAVADVSGAYEVIGMRFNFVYCLHMQGRHTAVSCMYEIGFGMKGSRTDSHNNVDSDHVKQTNSGCCT